MASDLTDDGGHPLPCVFVAMPFADERRHVYEDGILPAVASAGERRGEKLLTVRTDKGSGTFSLIRTLIQGIFEADVVVADISGLGANVLYELGVAHGFGRQTIIIADEETQIPFDIASYNVIRYSRGSSAMADLARQISAELVSRLDRGTGTLGNGPADDFAPIRYWDLVVSHHEVLRMESHVRESVWVIGPTVDMDISHFRGLISNNIRERRISYRYLLPETSTARRSWQQFLDRTELIAEPSDGLDVRFVDEHHIESEFVVYDPWTETEEVLITPPLETDTPYYFRAVGSRAVHFRNRFVDLWTLASS